MGHIVSNLRNIMISILSMLIFTNFYNSGLIYKRLMITLGSYLYIKAIEYLRVEHSYRIAP